MRKPLIFSFLIGLLCIQSIRAEIMGAYSVEWLTVESKVVAVGRVISVEKVKGPVAVLYETYTFEPSFIAKGGKTKTRIQFTIRTFSTEPIFGRKILLNDEIVVFLSDYVENEDFLRDKLVPTTNQFPLSVTKAAEPGKYFMGMNFQVLNNADEILSVAKSTVAAEKKYLKKSRKSSIKKGYLVVPDGTSAFRSLYSGSICFLFVPTFMSADATDKLF